MINILETVRTRLKDFLSFQSKTVGAYNATVNPSEFVLEDVSGFNLVFAMSNLQEVTFYIAGSPVRKVKAKIKHVNKDENKITCVKTDGVSPIDVNIPSGTIIKRTPNYQEVKSFIIGDPTTIANNALPAVCISPSSENEEWYTLLGTKLKVELDIIVHVQDAPNEEAVLTSARIAGDIKQLMNAQLHPKINREIDGYNRPFNSFSSNIEYGYSNKGSFCRSAKISWFSEEYWDRSYVVNQDLSTFDSFE
jgi:hypothetical protein